MLCEILQKLEPWADSILSGEGRGPTGAGGMREQVEDFPKKKMIIIFFYSTLSRAGGGQPVREEGEDFIADDHEHPHR